MFQGRLDSAMISGEIWNLSGLTLQEFILGLLKICLECEGLPGRAVLHVEFGNLACIHPLLFFPPPSVPLKVKKEYRNGILSLKCLGLEFAKVTSVHISLPGTTSHKDSLDNWRQGVSTTVQSEPLGAFSPSAPWPYYVFIPSVHPVAPSVLPSP